MSKRALVMAGIAFFCGLNISAQTADAGYSLAPIPLPPMGWSSWNSFSNTVDSANVIRQAQAIHASGLQKAGYVYVNIDEGWWLGNRDAAGNIVVDPKAWPAIKPGERDGDMRNIVRYIHSLGLKAGIYTDVGKDGCSMYPDIGPAYFHTGSEGHYEQDFLQFAEWGFDYVKVDWCGGERDNLDPAVQYGQIAHAIARAERVTGRKLYYSICEWGKQSPFTWGPGIGGSEQAIWRTGDDIVAPVVAGGPHTDRKVSFEQMLKNFDKNYHPEAEHTGYYNDPDMMVLGMPGMDAQEDRLHMSLWAIAAGPLLIGADVTKLDSETLADFTNPYAIAIDQDPAGLQAVKVAEKSYGLEVWSKFLAHPGERAVLLLNRSYFPAPMDVQWKDLGLAGNEASVKDVWTEKEMRNLRGGYNITVPAHDGVLLLVQGAEGDSKRYLPSPANTLWASSETLFDQISKPTGAWSQVRVSYRNHSAETAIVDLNVNDETITRLALPPTEENGGAVWLQVQLKDGLHNRLRFSSQKQVAIEAIEVY